MGARLLLFFSILGFVYFGYDKWAEMEYSQPDGVLVIDPPLQIDLPPNKRDPFELNDFHIEKVATWSMTARVLSKKTYIFDEVSAVAPIDVAFGWGPMSDNQLIKKLKISQGGRFFHVGWPDRLNPPAPFEQIMNNASNMHLIPADRLIRYKLKRLRPGQLAEIKGYLVNVRSSSGGRWNSSVVRTDRGAGACEIILVTSIIS